MAPQTHDMTSANLRRFARTKLNEGKDPILLCNMQQVPLRSVTTQDALGFPIEVQRFLLQPTSVPLLWDVPRACLFATLCCEQANTAVEQFPYPIPPRHIPTPDLDVLGIPVWRVVAAIADSALSCLMLGDPEVVATLIHLPKRPRDPAQNLKALGDEILHRARTRALKRQSDLLLSILLGEVPG